MHHRVVEVVSEKPAGEFDLVELLVRLFSSVHDHIDETEARIMATVQDLKDKADTLNAALADLDAREATEGAASQAAVDAAATALDTAIAHVQGEDPASATAPAPTPAPAQAVTGAPDGATQATAADAAPAPTPTETTLGSPATPPAGS